MLCSCVGACTIIHDMLYRLRAGKTLVCGNKKFPQISKVCPSPGTAAWLDGANIGLVCFGSWVIATLWSCLPMFGWGECSPEPYGLSCTVAWRGYYTFTKDALYVICSFAFFTLVPVLLIVVSQCQILLKVCRFSYSLSTRGIRINLRHAEKRLSMVSRRLQVL